MNDAEVEKFKLQLEKIILDLERQDDLGASGQKTVTLDQQSIGRLSRMDALQGQAMAIATAQRRQAEASRARAALQRIEEGEFGYCTDCGDDISPKRLLVNPSVSLCLSCAKG